MLKLGLGTYLRFGIWEDGPFEIRGLRLSVHQDFCEDEKKHSIGHRREFKSDTDEAHLHSEKHISEFKITEWTYFHSQALCQVSAMAYTGIRVEEFHQSITSTETFTLA